MSNPKDSAQNKAVRDFVADQLPGLLPNESKELVIRTGEAKEFDYPIQVNLHGTLGSPAEWLNKRINANQHDKLKCHLIVDRDNLKLTLRCDETFEKGAQITGSLKRFTDLTTFQINSRSHRWGVKELMGQLRTNRYYFLDKDEHARLVSNLMNFKAKFEKEMTATDDLKGNTLNSIETRLKHEVPLEFKLNIPVFKGGKPVSFRVEIMVDATSGGVQFYLESEELRELELQQRDQLIDDEVKKFNTDIVVIEV